MLVHTHGGVSNRPGTKYVSSVKDSAKAVRLIPFQFSTEQSYMLEFGDLYMRVYKDGAIVLHELADTPLWVATTVYAVGDFVDDGALIYRCILGHTAAAGDEPGVGGSWTTYWVQDDTYEIATPFAEADLPLIKYAQSYDVIFLTHPSYPPQELSRLDHNDWTIADIVFGPQISAPSGLTGGGPATTHNWKVTAVSADGEESITSAGDTRASGTLTWTAPATGTAEYYNVYMQKNGSGDFAWVARAASNSHVIDTSVNPDYSKVPVQSVNNPFSGVNNYPGVVSFFEQRLIFGRTNNKPQTIWGSQTGNLRNFNRSTPLQNDDSYEFTLNAREVNEIRWFVPLESLVIGTSAGEWRMSAGGNSDAVTPTSVNLKVQSSWGTGHQHPIVIGDSVLFVGSAGITARDLAYSLERDGYTGNELTVLANHLFENRTIVEWGFQQYPDPVIWVVMSDGELLGMTYAREHDVWGWHRHDLAGTIENIGVIPGGEADDDVYFCVKREIDGSDYRYIETLAERLAEDDVTKSWFLDSALRYDGWNTDTAKTMKLTTIGPTNYLDATGFAPFTVGSVGKYYAFEDSAGTTKFKVTVYQSTTQVEVEIINYLQPTLYNVDVSNWSLMATTLSGLSHLEGEVVGVLGDGSVLNDLTVSGGAVTLEHPVSRVLVGLKFLSVMETLEIELPVDGKTLQDKFRNLVQLTTLIQKSRSIFAGPASSQNLDEVKFRTDEMYGAPIDLYTGYKELPVESGRGKTARLRIENRDQVPLTVLTVIPRIDFGD